MCWAMAHILKSCGHEVTTVSSGAEALTLLRKSRFPLIFMDAKLPDTDGLDVAWLVRQRYPDTFIVLVSGYYYADDPAIREASERRTINHFIAKPFARKDILDMLERVAQTG